ncbi:MAG: bifunctional diaminohydroxyphosphoribosylaminopyrimidine deaminase/5-amino-6-(5-phosphoribosylamino)uracil reductase RibD [Calditrichaceae bacterium]|nr:bifunctional diaminohydroxyphosphoribosylaminopyrimidine deaminase/5-amino-6-(5-phosphoribosylamino)uracil reductase RibD [Calditrichaceae bacterium]MBN2707433.1 bifunctional diaminohydroxyphosphoribosylaminopyrimidine deaminase/5-amino-6-(5-phosphoribosylamino)uracil reductase RibD [Calditrichaceae bacterium]RQV94001.1 MAG: bifunctional diaminohydroxyphosphoribosylaminopyrimidine deaminase/5-amino-6-(5-phosphoribosylamino)uracil reductase RibD [Calditrichota bacterium]
MLTIEEKYIRRCFRLALKGVGKVSPNPLVGAVLVKDGKVIGEGYHKGSGKPHAEIEAISSAMESVKGSVLYCNLEPCCHSNKKTPPCVPVIIRGGISKVVISNIDPNPQVSGKGLLALEKAGIKTIKGIEEEKGRHLNRFFFTYMEKKRPYIIMKIAQTLNGMISEKQGISSRITGAESLKDVHRLRAECDAVLIGANTVNVDDPRLTVREAKGQNPHRIILDGNLNSNPQATIFNIKDKAHTFLLVSKKTGAEKIKKYQGQGLELKFLNGNEKDCLDLNDVIQELYRLQILSLLVEGGAQIFTQFLEKNLFDELIIYQSSGLFKNGVKAFNSATEKKLKLVSAEQFGNDVKMVYHPLL